MKKLFLFSLFLACLIIPCQAVTLSHMQYVTTANFPTSNAQYDETFDIDTNFWFVYRNSDTNATTLVISNESIDGNYTLNNSTMPVVGDTSIYYTSVKNNFIYTYTYIYNSVSGTWDFQSRSSYWDQKTVEYPASYLYQSSPVDFYNVSGEVVFPGPLEIWSLRLGETIVRAEVPAVRSTMKTLALFGVGCLALLIILSLFGNPFRLFLRR